MSSPRVSVVMAVYNGEKSVKKTIESILNQTYRDFEFVIVNDCSSDRTLDIIKSCSDSRIVVYTNAVNLGQTKSLNLGLQRSSGQYIARIDAGDISLPARLEKQVTYLDAHDEIAAVGTGAFRYDPNGRVIDVVYMPRTQSAMLRNIVFTVPLIHVSVMMRSDMIRGLGGYNEDYQVLADYELWSRLLKKGFHLMNLREILVGYEVSPESFGGRHVSGRSLNEASRIIQSNIKDFFGRQISIDQASDIYRFFNLDMIRFPRQKMDAAAQLSEDAMRALQMSKREIHYCLLRKYAKCMVRYVFNPRGANLLHILNLFLGNSYGLFFWRGIAEDMTRALQSIVWRHRSNPIKLRS